MTAITSPRGRGRPRIDLRRRTRGQQAMHLLIQTLAAWRPQENAQGVALGANNTSTITATNGGHSNSRKRHDDFSQL